MCEPVLKGHGKYGVASKQCAYIRDADIYELHMQGLALLKEVLEKLPEALNVSDIRTRITELTPYVVVAIQVHST